MKYIYLIITLTLLSCSKDETIKDFGIKFYVLQEKIYTILEIQKKNKDV